MGRDWWCGCVMWMIVRDSEFGIEIVASSCFSWY